MDLDYMHSFINQALVDKAIQVLNEYRQIETSPQPQHVKDLAGKNALRALRSILSYMEGDFGILSMEDIKKAKELEDKEDQFIEIAKQNQSLISELRLAKNRWAKLQDTGVVDEKGAPAKKVKKKPTSKKKKKPTAKKASPRKTKKKKKTPPKKSEERSSSVGAICKKCGREFKSNAGAARHAKSCKG